MKIETIIKNNRLIGILRNVDNNILPYYIEAIIKGGIHAVEIAMNTPDGAEQIARTKSQFGSDILIGAGTAITPERINEAYDAGATFFLTPSATEDILRYFHQRNLSVLPGVFSPSDVEICLKYGMRTLKLFPAADLPLSYIKSMKGPFSNTDYVAVGGVNLNNLAGFFNSGFIGAGIASSLIPEHYVQEKDWKGAANHVRLFSKIAEESIKRSLE